MDIKNAEILVTNPNLMLGMESPGLKKQQKPISWERFGAHPFSELLNRSPCCNHLKHVAFSTQIKGNHNLQGNVQVYHVRVPVFGVVFKGDRKDSHFVGRVVPPGRWFLFFLLKEASLFLVILKNQASRVKKENIQQVSSVQKSRQRGFCKTSLIVRKRQPVQLIVRKITGFQLPLLASSKQGLKAARLASGFGPLRLQTNGACFAFKEIPRNDQDAEVPMQMTPPHSLEWHSLEGYTY